MGERNNENGSFAVPAFKETLCRKQILAVMWLQRHKPSLSLTSMDGINGINHQTCGSTDIR
jgi:hypothetical protein